MGTLSDEGALALLSAARVKTLKCLDVSHNFCSPDVLNELLTLRASGLEVNVEQNLWGEGWRFTAVGE
jgi:hypothetical protein